MNISIDLKLLARLLGCMEWVWIFCLILLCIGQSIGTDIEAMDLTLLTWLMMINTMAILWIVFRLTRQSVEDMAKKEKVDE